MSAVVIFAHGSGSSYQSPRNRQVAQTLNDAGFGTLLFDLLTEAEALDRANVFNIDLLSDRLIAATEWVRQELKDMSIPIAYFGASTGAAAALVAASRRDDIFAVVSRGGRVDMAAESLERVKCPVLMIVGGNDETVLTLNERAQARLPHSHLVIVPGASHVFPEPGALEQVAELARDWFSRHVEVELEESSILVPH
ncbi:MAG TPA: alpha/beta family hydrolase [Bdellovibrionales bacterium]|nr:alpha/beta family hydrolase [Bdellovibrionales bacterium]